MAKSTPQDDATDSARIDAYIAGTGDWRGGMLTRIRKAIFAADPAMTEAWKYRGSPVFECHGQVAVANAHKDKVKITFAQGAHVPDPDGLFNAGLDGNRWRAIDLFEGDALDDAALTALVRAAVEYNLLKRRKK